MRIQQIELKNIGVFETSTNFSLQHDNALQGSMVAITTNRGSIIKHKKPIFIRSAICFYSSTL